MAIRAVIFDIGGVLLQQNERELAQEWEQRLKLRPGELNILLNKSGSGTATVGKMSVHDVWQRLGERLGLSEEQTLELENGFVPKDTLNAELADFLQSLRPGRTTALLSNAWPGTREALSSKFGLDKMADTMIFSYEVGLAKPDIKIYQLVVHRLGINPEETIFLDNKIVNVEAAQLVGIRAILYKDNEQAIAAIQKQLDRGR